MTERQRSRPIVVVVDTHGQESRLRSRLEQATERDIRTVCQHESPLESLTETADVDRDRRAATNAEHSDDSASFSTEDTAADGETAPIEPSAVVLELDRPGAVQSLLRRVHAALPDVPTIVAPHDGSERLATVAVRADAADYVPIDGDDDPVDRIVEPIQAEPSIRSAADDSRYQRLLAPELPDEAFVIGEDGTYLEAKARPESGDFDSVPADELVGTTIEDVFPDAVAADLQDCIDQATRTDDVQSTEYRTDTTDGCRQFEARVVPIDERIQGRRAVVWLARDITERVERERRLRSRQDQLETLNRINAVVGQVIETLVEAPARDAIEREVCEQLVGSELYCGSWITEWTGDGQLSYRTGAGRAKAVLERVRACTAEYENPILQAAQTGELQTITRALENESLPDELRAAAREDDVRSGIVVPITHEDATYGVLTVLASRDDAFSERERAGFRLLGETIGFTIMAVKNRQLLFADSVVELEFRIDRGETFCFDLTERYDCTGSLEWAGTTSNGHISQYVTIDGVDGETALETATAHDSVEECRLIYDGDERCTLELRLTRSVVRTLANHGATVRDVTVEDGDGTCVVEVSQDADIRKIAEALTITCENAELVARREVDRAVRTAAQRRSRILDELTDRQLTTLRLAYYGGFFDWPRKSTGEEIAEAMDISPPTMHQHLRKGLKSILREFFDDSSGTSESFD